MLRCCFGVARREIETGFSAGEGASDGRGGWFDGDGACVGRGELEAVEKDGSAFGGDAVAGEGGDEERDGDLNGLDVFEGREVEFDGILRGVIGQILGRSDAEEEGLGLCSTRAELFSTRFLWRRWRREWK